MATNRICSIEGCGKKHQAHGWCFAHYIRWRVHGDPMKNKKDEPSEQRDFFENVVLAHSGTECLLWPYRTNAAGYPSAIRMNGRRIPVHRLVCLSVHGAPPTEKHEAAHSCGVRQCCSPSHLSWKTRSENQMDRVEHGTSNRGDRHRSSMLSEQDVRYIRSMKDKVSMGELARKFGVRVQSIHAIYTGKSWSWLV